MPRRALLVIVLVAAGAGPARADTGAELAADLAAIDAGDARAVIARLRPQLATLDPAGRCALGLAYAGRRPARKQPRPDRTRGLIYLASCADDLPAAIADRVEAARAQLAALAERAGDTRVEIVVRNTDALAVDIDRLAGDVVIAPTTVWLPAGTYELTGHAGGTLLRSALAIGARSSASVLFEVPRDAPREPVTKAIDFEGGEPEAAHVGPPPKQVHPSMIGDRYEKGLRANRTRQWSDPDRLPEGPVRSTLGLRFGGGVADSAAGTAVGALSVAVLARAAIDPAALAGEIRLDVGHRGSDAARLLTAGIGAQARWYPVERTAMHGLSIAGGARFEVRLADSIEAMPVERFGLGATAGVGWEPGGKRFSLELRGEQSLTRIAGARARALLLEVGFNLP